MRTTTSPWFTWPAEPKPIRANSVTISLWRLRMSSTMRRRESVYSMLEPSGARRRTRKRPSSCSGVKVLPMLAKKKALLATVPGSARRPSSGGQRGVEQAAVEPLHAAEDAVEQVIERGRADFSTFR
jgi:hypothetical protein